MRDIARSAISRNKIDLHREINSATVKRPINAELLPPLPNSVFLVDAKHRNAREDAGALYFVPLNATSDCYRAPLVSIVAKHEKGGMSRAHLRRTAVAGNRDAKNLDCSLLS